MFNLIAFCRYINDLLFLHEKILWSDIFLLQICVVVFLQDIQLCLICFKESLYLQLSAENFFPFFLSKFFLQKVSSKISVTSPFSEIFSAETSPYPIFICRNINENSVSKFVFLKKFAENYFTAFFCRKFLQLNNFEEKFYLLYMFLQKSFFIFLQKVLWSYFFLYQLKLLPQKILATYLSAEGFVFWLKIIVISSNLSAR